MCSVLLLPAHAARRLASFAFLHSRGGCVSSVGSGCVSSVGVTNVPVGSESSTGSVWPVGRCICDCGCSEDEEVE